MFIHVQVTLATFATYVMTGGVLDASKAFTSLSLFNILRFPIIDLPIMMNLAVTVGSFRK
jgi:ATP-binding cassette, subfamily C (CFTR/MRP), member 1